MVTDQQTYKMKAISVCVVAILLISLANAADFNEKCYGNCTAHPDGAEPVQVNSGMLSKKSIDRHVSHTVQVSN